MATSVGRGIIGLTLFNSPALKTLDGRKNLGDISYTNRVIAYFV